MKQRNLIITVLIVGTLAVAAWAFGFLGGTDPAIAELQQMAAQAFGQDLSVAQEAELRQQFRQKMDGLTPEQRESFFDANRDRWMQRMETRMNGFFAMSPAEQQKRLDGIIDQMNRPRDSRAQNGGGDRGGWGNMTEAQRDERSKRRLDQTSPKMRAQFTEFRKKLEVRAKERGISQLPGWGPGGRRG
jgi:hypothetical protein